MSLKLEGSDQKALSHQTVGRVIADKHQTRDFKLR